MRQHDPIELDEFNGLYQRGAAETCPQDHFSDCQNIQFFGTREFGTRDGLGLHQNVVAPLGQLLRIYNYITQDKNTLIVLKRNEGTGNGEIYHVVDSTTVFGPILTKAGMTDFGFVQFAGRGYITPFTSYTFSPANIEKGLQNEFLYVYLGDGTAARKAAGNPPTAGSLTIVNGTGATDAGFHLFGVLYETDTGFLTAPSRFTGFTTLATNGVSFSGIPTSPDSFVVARRIVATKKILNYNGDTTGYQYFMLPNGRIPDNVTTTLSNITFFDADLLEDASHLIDNFAEIPAGVGVTLYHDRLILYTSFTDISLIRVSAPGEPEAINQINGLLIMPLDGNPVTNAQEMRDVLYTFKRNRTASWVDNDDVPSSWPMSMIDYGLGCPVHGIATVLDSGSSNVDFLLVTTYGGIMIFNGRYSDPPLTWKIEDFWDAQNRNNFRRIQIVNDTVGGFIFCALPDRRLLEGNYNNGMNPKDIRWTVYKFDIEVTTIGIANISDIIIGSEITYFG